MRILLSQRRNKHGWVREYIVNIKLFADSSNLIALMLGRLQMTTDKALKVYNIIACPVGNFFRK